MEIKNHLLEAAAGEPVTVLSPPAGIPLGALNPFVDTLILRSVQASSLGNARNIYSAPDRVQLAHILIGRDGLQASQMMPFNRKVGFNWRFNSSAITVGLVTPGEMLVPDRHVSFFNHISKFQSSDYLKAFADHDNRFRYWANFPDAQLDLLVDVCSLLIQTYGLRTVQTYTDLVTTALDPEPTLPKVALFEILKKAHNGLDLDLRVLEATNEDVSLRNEAAPEAPVISAVVPSGTDVAVIDEGGDWSLVEVLEPVEGRRWLKGWLETKSIQTGKSKPGVENHRLVGAGGRRYKYDEAARGNFNSRPDTNVPKYVVMHFTTGTQVRQTINNFKSPAAGVSTHLVIGRDGRTIQCVPFNHAAQHCGFSYWEDQERLNNCTIGIELDNAGYLSWDPRRQVWLRKTTVIPDERVVKARHIKDFSERAWEDFPPQQVEAAMAIVKSLCKHYDIQDIIGHDQVNIKFRRDPGPLFEKHMRAMRQEIFGREEPDTVAYHATSAFGEPIDLFVDFLGKKPVINHPQVDGVRLRNNQIIVELEVNGIWSKIRVPGARQTTGWVLTRNLRTVATTRRKIVGEDVPFYADLTGKESGPPPTLHPNGPLQPGHVMRLQRVRGDMALIATLIKTIVRGEEQERLIEGWVRRDQIVE